MLQPDAFCEHTFAEKCDCGRTAAPDPAGGAYSAPPPTDSLTGFKGAASRRGGGGGRDERGTEGREVKRG